MPLPWPSTLHSYRELFNVCLFQSHSQDFSRETDIWKRTISCMHNPREWYAFLSSITAVNPMMLPPPWTSILWRNISPLPPNFVGSSRVSTCLSWAQKCLLCDCSNSKEDNSPGPSLLRPILGRLGCYQQSHFVVVVVRSQSTVKETKCNTKQSWTNGKSYWHLRAWAVTLSFHVLCIRWTNEFLPLSWS